MRKDVKFGLTIGAILLATLTVYVIVLSHGGTGSPSNPDLTISTTGAPAPGADGTTPTSTDNLPAPTSDKPATDAQNPAPTTPDLANTSEVASTPAKPLENNPPATQPGSTIADASTDWNYALNHGQVKLLAAGAPERTVTPTIDRAVATQTPNTVGPDVHPALIDAPSTQPAELAAPIPTPVPLVDDQASPATTPRAANGQRTHVVARGETLSAIAATVYGNSKYYTKIEAANPGVDARHLKIGATLIIPSLTDTDRSVSSAAVSPAAPAVDPAKGYTVVSGDTLEKISMKLYGNSQMIEKIYQLNKAKIGPDENRLSIGWVLKLPEPPSSPSSVTASARQ